MGARTRVMLIGIVACALLAGGCRERDRRARFEAGPHEHALGAHGGHLVNIGPRYHAEAVFERGGRVCVFMLATDPSEVREVEAQALSAYAKGTSDAEAVTLTLQPEPQPGDTAGRTSRFVGQLPEELAGREVMVSVPTITIDGRRFRFGFSNRSAGHAEMPAGVGDDEERELYLTAGGRYREEDIEANGRRTASQAYGSFRAEHDFSPQSGDPICPITRTKAHPRCSWVVDGQTYMFCCPPCIDEWVKLAKTEPERLEPPERFVQP